MFSSKYIWLVSYQVFLDTDLVEISPREGQRHARETGTRDQEQRDQLPVGLQRGDEVQPRGQGHVVLGGRHQLAAPLCSLMECFTPWYEKGPCETSGSKEFRKHFSS